jgi:hypothetical protein
VGLRKRPQERAGKKTAPCCKFGRVRSSTMARPASALHCSMGFAAVVPNFESRSADDPEPPTGSAAPVAWTISTALPIRLACLGFA